MQARRATVRINCAGLSAHGSPNAPPQSGTCFKRTKKTHLGSYVLPLLYENGLSVVFKLIWLTRGPLILPHELGKHG